MPLSVKQKHLHIYNSSEQLVNCHC